MRLKTMEETAIVKVSVEIVAGHKRTLTCSTRLVYEVESSNALRPKRKDRKQAGSVAYASIQGRMVSVNVLVSREVDDMTWTA